MPTINQVWFQGLICQKFYFDPLEYIVRKAKSEEIKIHAWINVFYLWSSPQTPSQNGHILLNHPDWIDTKIPDQMNVSQTLNAMKKIGK